MQGPKDTYDPIVSKEWIKSHSIKKKGKSRTGCRKNMWRKETSIIGHLLIMVIVIWLIFDSKFQEGGINMPSPKDTHGPLVKTGPTARRVRSQNQDGTWRKKRSDAGTKRK